MRISANKKKCSFYKVTTKKKQEWIPKRTLNDDHVFSPTSSVSHFLQYW